MGGRAASGTGLTSTAMGADTGADAIGASAADAAGGGTGEDGTNCDAS